MDKLSSTEAFPVTDQREDIENKPHIIITRIDIEKQFLNEAVSEFDSPRINSLAEGHELMSSQRSLASASINSFSPFKAQAKSFVETQSRPKRRTSNKIGKSVLYSITSSPLNTDPTSILAGFVS